MAELVEITRALDLVREFPPLHRILLTCTGTLQGTLSAYFGEEVRVEVVRQSFEDRDSHIVVYRRADLYIPRADSPLVVCRARSDLAIASGEVKTRVLSRELGIGQVLEVLGLRPSFTLLHVGRDHQAFWRAYKLEAAGVTYEIRERFPLELYR